MTHTSHVDVTLGASTVLAGCALTLLVAVYIWSAVGLVRMAQVGVPALARSFLSPL
jgi:hypothetical protein